MAKCKYCGTEITKETLPDVVIVDNKTVYCSSDCEYHGKMYDGYFNRPRCENVNPITPRENGTG